MRPRHCLVLSRLTDNPNPDQLIKRLYALAESCVGEKVEYDQYPINNKEELKSILNKVLEANSDLVVPMISDIIAFGSSRRTGFWGELGEPYICFNSDEVFERVLTDQGKNLQKVIGKPLDLTSWVEESY
jgi:hypothetical protein